LIEFEVQDSQFFLGIENFTRENTAIQYFFRGGGVEFASRPPPGLRDIRWVGTAAGSMPRCWEAPQSRQATHWENQIPVVSHWGVIHPKLQNLTKIFHLEFLRKRKAYVAYSICSNKTLPAL